MGRNRNMNVLTYTFFVVSIVFKEYSSWSVYDIDQIILRIVHRRNNCLKKVKTESDFAQIGFVEF